MAKWNEARTKGDIMLRVILGAVTASLLLVSPVLGASISVGAHRLEPDKAGQVIQIHVTGGEAVDGLDFFLQVADGGPEVGGSIDGPAITNVDIFTATAFDGNNTGEHADGSLTPQFWQSGTSTKSGTVTADGPLATVTIDTTGFFSTDAVTTWHLKMADTFMGDSRLESPPPRVSTVITNGSILVPEPSHLGGLVLGGMCLAWLRARRRRRR